jgi:hypothetical protein
VVPPFHETVTMPPRVDVELFAAALIVSVVESLPDVALVIVSQLAFDDAAHVQLPDVFVSATLNVPPAAGGACDVDDTEYAHGVGVVGVVGALLSLLHPATSTAAAANAIQKSFMWTLNCEFNATLNNDAISATSDRMHGSAT